MAYTVHFEPVGLEIQVEEGETVLQAAFRQGISLMHGCKEGQCSSCKSVLLDGEVDLLRYSTFALSDDDREMGYTLLCRAEPLEDLTVELLNWDEDTLLMKAPVAVHQSRVEAVERLTDDMRLLALTLADEMPYGAGQYVDIRVPGTTDSVRSFSMCSTPNGDLHRLEFMIKVFPDGLFSGQLDGGIRPGDPLEIIGPYGHFQLRNRDSDAIFIGGGSGMSPLWSMLNDIAERGIRRRVTFFYGARRGGDLFYLDRLQALSSRLSDFEFVPALSEPQEDDDWDGETGFVTEVAGRRLDRDQLRGEVEAYLCGPPPMIDAAFPVLFQKGIPGTRIYYDKFTAATS
ncbi:MAG TPA: 2Fe-2S iron-sulfur cluster binding domain-containing protein [Terriglobales bacterium]|nr:2Fe-2S iron-sulfur cluster binding domain-containing protein [Terriglobales bacterium]